MKLIKTKATQFAYRRRLSIIPIMASSVATVLQELRLNPRFATQITAWQRLPARPGRFSPVPDGLEPQLQEALRRQGIQQLYAHQSQAIAAALRGEDVAVVTGAASGKTLCYNVPVLNALLRDPQARALYLFPTKALAQDQLAAWQGMSQDLLPPTTAATYDGDTLASVRARLRENTRVLITNPDMLHVGILPHHTRWATFFAGLKYVVIDEMHAYRGVFGSHVANLLRRLRRICRFYGAHPTFICCSATIANPQELATLLVGRQVLLVDDDGSPRGERHVILYNPPLVDQAQGIRRNLLLETATVADFFLSKGLPTIVFSQGRLSTELLLTYLRQAAEKREQPPGSIRGYRGGYLPRERRAIERGLREGKVRGVVSTNALELGIDIGELSICVLAGYPGTIASTWQQAGRAGRRQDVSAAVLVGGPSALDQYLLSHPSFFFGRTPEEARLSPDNPFLLRSHLKCAAFELPIADDEQWAGDVDVPSLLKELAESEGVLRYSRQRWYWMSNYYPSQEVSLRTATQDHFSIVEKGSGQVIGQVDSLSAPMLIHPGAVYLHEGQSYLVEELDWEERLAHVRAAKTDYFTTADLSMQVEVLRVLESSSEQATSRVHGEVRVRTKAAHFQQIAWYNHKKLATLPLDLPEQELLTTAYWLSLGEEVVTAMRDLGDWTIAPIVSYGPNWAAQRRRARERDRYRCVHCGAPEPPDREHDVHHIRPFRTFDYRPGQNENYLAANDLSNLVTLCSECHRRLETARAMQGTLDGLANLLRALAPLYLMCEPRDLGVTADLDFPFTRAPTVVIYDAVPGGVGFSAALYRLQDDLLRACHEWVRQCPCEEGCPACVGAPVEIGMGAKERVKQLLEWVLE
nr:DEAD/DEAH box helicase [Chloroflexota bacterium]